MLVYVHKPSQWDLVNVLIEGTNFVVDLDLSRPKLRVACIAGAVSILEAVYSDGLITSPNQDVKIDIKTFSKSARLAVLKVFGIPQEHLSMVQRMDFFLKSFAGQAYGGRNFLLSLSEATKYFPGSLVEHVLKLHADVEH